MKVHQGVRLLWGDVRAQRERVVHVGDKKYMRVWDLSTATCYAEYLVCTYYLRLEPASS
jgi:hypothetical protein